MSRSEDQLHMCLYTSALTEADHACLYCSRAERNVVNCKLRINSATKLRGPTDCMSRRYKYIRIVSRGESSFPVQRTSLLSIGHRFLESLECSVMHKASRLRLVYACYSWEIALNDGIEASINTMQNWRAIQEIAREVIIRSIT
jgi:hypothetical protein